MALTVTVHGQGTFTASMEEGPVTFTAAIASVGPQGATGPTGPAGVVAATAPITYNAGTQTVGISATPTFTSVTATTGNLTTVNLTTATFADATSQTTAFVGEARKEYVIARNDTGSTIAAGKVVYISGATGNKPTMALAQANSESTSARTIGITVESVANNADGKVVISGAAENIDTSAFTAGQVVYLSSSTAGGLQTTLPAAPNHGVVVGIVTRANPSVGSIEVFIQNYQELAELSDVNVSDKANNDGLFWESSSSTWRSKTIAEVLGYTPANGTDYLAKADNLSGLASTSTARTNLGLGTMAVETATDYLTKAGNLSGLASNATARTNLDVYSKSESDALVPAASTTVAGKVELATDAEAILGLDTSRAVTPSGLASNVRAVSRIFTVAANYINGTSGTGAAAAAFYSGNRVSSPTSGAGYGNRNIALSWLRRAVNSETGTFAFSKKIWVSCRLSHMVVPTDTNVVSRVMFGKAYNTAANDLAGNGIGVRRIADGALELQVHNGTTLTNVTSSFTPVATETFDVLIYSDGSGNVTLYVNGSSVATTSAGPTGVSAATPALHVEAQSLGTFTGNRSTISMFNALVETE